MSQTISSRTFGEERIMKQLECCHEPSGASLNHGNCSVYFTRVPSAPILPDAVTATIFFRQGKVLEPLRSTPYVLRGYLPTNTSHTTTL